VKRILLIATALSLVLFACFDAPIGRPAAAHLDPRLSGLWVRHEKPEADYEGWLAVPLDTHVYCLMHAKFNVKDGKATAQDEYPAVRGWISDVAKSTFLSLEPIPQLLPEYKDKRGYVSARLVFDDKGNVAVQPLSTKFKDLAHVKEGVTLAKLVEENIQDPALFDETQTFRRADPANAIEKQILEHFLGTGKN
jgi:hypothetical protein